MRQIVFVGQSIGKTERIVHALDVIDHTAPRSITFPDGDGNWIDPMHSHIRRAVDTISEKCAHGIERARIQEPRAKGWKPKGKQRLKGLRP